MYLCTRREIWTSFSCSVLLKCYHVVFSQFKIPTNLAQLAVPQMHCLYANAVVQPSVQHCPCYMAWKTKVHTWCRHCHFCINAPMWREKRWLQGFFDPPSYTNTPRNYWTRNPSPSSNGWAEFWPEPMKNLVDMPNHAQWLRITHGGGKTSDLLHNESWRIKIATWKCEW